MIDQIPSLYAYLANVHLNDEIIFSNFSTHRQRHYPLHYFLLNYDLGGRILLGFALKVRSKVAVIF